LHVAQLKQRECHAGGLAVAAAAGMIVAAATSDQGPVSNNAPASNDTTVTAPGTRVDTTDEKTRVEAPFTTVDKDRDKVRVQAPFVDIEVPKKPDRN
jgi:hypothetical protein